MQKSLFLAVLSALCFIFIIVPIHSDSVPIVGKDKLIYEITHFDINHNHLILHGFAFMIDTQHFIDSSTHSIQLEFKSPNHTFIVDTILTDIDQTELMRYQGTSRCSINYQKDNACYYDYKNVGFDAYVDLSQIHDDTDYIVYLIVNAYNASTSAKIPLFCPMQQDLTIDNNSEQITIKSRLDQTRLTVLADTVFARKEPFKNAEVLKEGLGCSLSYGNTGYFKKDSVFYNIYNKSFINNTSYYQVYVDLDDCHNLRRRVKEGYTYPVWIASVFVNYSGSVMTINKKLINAKPILNGPDYIEIYQNDEFEIENYFSAYDKEDGDLTKKIHIVDGDITTSTIHNSLVLLEVKDSAYQIARKQFYLNIIKKPNNEPQIYADDQIIYQYEDYDPLINIKAYDKEDGNLTKSVKITENTVNTEDIGEYRVSYTVKDSEGEVTNKTIKVTVVENPNVVNKIRYLDSNDCISSINDNSLNWKKHINELNIACKLDNIQNKREIN